MDRMDLLPLRRHVLRRKRLYQVSIEQVFEILEGPLLEQANKEVGRREAWGQVDGRWIQIV